MKKIFLFLILFNVLRPAISKTDSVDVYAVVLLDRMSDVIGELSSCSFNLKTSVDKIDPTLGLIKEYALHHVHAVGPDKLHVQTKGAKNNHAYWYNGDILMYYSVAYNHYGFIETPDNLIEAIEYINEVYDIEIPAADFFYPTFTDDILEHSDHVKYMGKVTIDGVECHHILAQGPEQHVQLWINSDTFTLPARYVVLKKSGEHTIQFEGIFSDWVINPDLPNSIFDFTAPESARRISFVPKR